MMARNSEYGQFLGLPEYLVYYTAWTIFPQSRCVIKIRELKNHVALLQGGCTAVRIG